MTDSSNANTPETQLLAYRWLTVITTIGVLAQALLASQGVWGGHRGLITGHGNVGSAIFLLAILQAFLAFQLSTSKVLHRHLLWVNLIAVVLVVTQLALGYAKDSNATAWHVTNGVLLMGVDAFLATTAWLVPNRRRD